MTTIKSNPHASTEQESIFQTVSTLVLDAFKGWPRQSEFQQLQRILPQMIDLVNNMQDAGDLSAEEIDTITRVLASKFIEFQLAHYLTDALSSISVAYGEQG